MWENTILADYSIPLIGVLIFSFLIISARKKTVSVTNTLGKNDFLGVFVLTAGIFLLIFSTGEFNSPLFFLLYFLEFGLGFVFSPVSVFLFLIGTFVLFLPDALKNDVISNLFRLIPLLIISPLAFFFGKEFQEKDVKDSLPKKTTAQK
jgi:hypothetical protein